QGYSNGATNVTLQSYAAVTLSVNGPASQNNINITAGSQLQLSAVNSNSINLTIVTTANQLANIAGTLTLNTNTTNNNTFTTNAVGTTVVTVPSGGAITNNGGTVTSSAATLLFTNGSFYNHNMTAGTIPTATFFTAGTIT